jgi:hypothetical protein
LKLLPVIFKRQLASYACTPSTYLSVAAFLVLGAALGLYTTPWMERAAASKGYLVAKTVDNVIQAPWFQTQ